MASPQTENGHIRIASDLYRNAMSRLTPTQFKVWCGILDFTYNRRKKDAVIRYADLARVVNMAERVVVRYCQELETANVIYIIRQKGGPNTIGPNKDYDSWQRGVETGTGADSVTGVETGTGGVTELAPHGCRNCHPTGTENDTPIPYRISSMSSTMSSTMHDGANAPTPRPLVEAYLSIFAIQIPNRNGKLQDWNTLALDIEDMPEYDEDFAIAAIKAWKDQCFEAYLAYQREHSRKVGPPDFSYFAKSTDERAGMLEQAMRMRELPGQKKKAAKTPKEDLNW